MALQSTSTCDRLAARVDSKKCRKLEDAAFLKWKSWVLCSYEHFVPIFTEAKEIILEASKVKNDFPSGLNPVFLGRIIAEIWGQKVKVVRRGPVNDRQTGYLNLRRKEINEASHETFEEFMKSEIKLGERWSKISDHPKSISIIRYETWSFNNHRVTTEIRLTQLSPSELKYTLVSHGYEIDLANLLDIKTIERHKLSDRIKLIISFIDNSHLCQGASVEDDRPYFSTSNVVVKCVDFANGNKEETKVFSRNCFIINRRDAKYCFKCRVVKKLCLKTKKRRLLRKEIHPKTNKRYMSKDEIAEQFKKEKRQKKIHVEKNGTEQTT